MNHCLLEVQVKKAQTVRYTQDNQIPIAEMEVLFDGLRPDDSPGELKVVGWGNMAQDLQAHVKIGQKLVLEGRLRMNTLPRQDGTKEKRAELTLSKLHNLSALNQGENKASDFKSQPPNPINTDSKPSNLSKSESLEPTQDEVSWNSSPLIPDTDDIPF